MSEVSPTRVDEIDVRNSVHQGLLALRDARQADLGGIYVRLLDGGLSAESRGELMKWAAAHIREEARIMARIESLFQPKTDSDPSISLIQSLVKEANNV